MQSFLQVLNEVAQAMRWIAPFYDVDDIPYYTLAKGPSLESS